MKIKKTISKKVVWSVILGVVATASVATAAAGVNGSQTLVSKDQAKTKTNFNGDFSQFPSVSVATIQRAVLAVAAAKLENLVITKTNSNTYVVKVPAADSLALAQSAFSLKRLLFFSIGGYNQEDVLRKTNLLTYVEGNDLSSVSALQAAFERGIDVTNFVTSNYFTAITPFSISVTLMASATLLPNSITNDSSGAFASARILNRIGQTNPEPPLESPFANLDNFDRAYRTRTLLSFGGTWNAPRLDVSPTLITNELQSKVDFTYRYEDAAETYYDLATFNNRFVSQNGWSGLSRRVEAKLSAKPGYFLRFSNDPTQNRTVARFLVDNATRQPALLASLVSGVTLTGSTKNAQLIRPQNVEGANFYYEFEESGLYALGIPTHLKKASGLYTADEAQAILSSPLVNLLHVENQTLSFALWKLNAVVIDTKPFGQTVRQTVWSPRTSQLTLDYESK